MRSVHPSRAGLRSRAAFAVAGSLAVAGMLPLAGCDNSTKETAQHATGESTPSLPLAADAGGACQLLDYDTVNGLLGVKFEVAAAAQQDNTYTCVLQGRATSLPDLTLAVSESTAGPEAFSAAMRPKGAAAVDGLGKVGYSAVRRPAGGVGPAVEVGWLAGNNRILQLRMRLPVSTTVDPVLTGKLVELARKVDLSSI